MRITFVDVENTTTVWQNIKRNGDEETLKDISPYRPNNKLVSVGMHHAECMHYMAMNHISIDFNPCIAVANQSNIQNILNNTDLLVAHNMKHDLAWVWAAGFKYEGKIWCTQVAEYLSNRGVKSGLSLKALAEKHNLGHTKSDVTFDWEHLDECDWDTLKEYGVYDILTLKDLYIVQAERYSTVDHSLAATMTMSMDFLKELIHMEGTGAHIDLDELAVLEKEYLAEYAELEADLLRMAREVMGDTPIRLGSPDFRSELLYSRKVLDKKEWKETFNIRTDERGKKKLKPNFNKKRFSQIVHNGTELSYKTTVHHCEECKGEGKIHYSKKDGSPMKKVNNCRTCKGAGYFYTPIGDTKNDIAGFKLSARGVKDTSAGGFATDADTLEQLIGGASGDAKVFLDKYSRLNAINTYLDTFVAGIRKFTDDNSILRTQLNQTITATGRLSSTSPNLHNQPRGGTFPVRRVFTSRFPGGSIAKADYATLEYRTAGLLAGCTTVLNAIRTKEDAHGYTRDTINSHEDTGTRGNDPINRQDAKPHTFKPLYGGKSGTDREKHYYTAFIEKHHAIKKWHETLLSTALNTNRITLPSGRQYNFPNVYRTYSGWVNDSTQVVNYPVQGFATADLVPIGVIAVGTKMRELNVKSKLFLTVHDEVDIDIYPGEEQMITDLVIDGMLSILEGSNKYYGIDFKWPFGCEFNVGSNWLNCKEVAAGEINYSTGEVVKTYAN